jgi:hypothetical protein
VTVEPPFADPALNQWNLPFAPVKEDKDVDVPREKILYIGFSAFFSASPIRVGSYGDSPPFAPGSLTSPVIAR